MSAPIPPVAKPLFITLDADGSITVDGKDVSLNAFFDAEGKVTDPEALKAELDRIAAEHSSHA